MGYRRNVKLTISYDGAGYHGWQRQASGIETVQETLENVMARVVQHPVNLRGSGRTDTGVHARGQVANFVTDTRIPTRNLPYTLNRRLPGDIRITAAADVPDDFDAITSARAKLYRYTVYNGMLPPAQMAQRSYHFYMPCDVGAMQAAAQQLLGRRDFSSFASAGAPRQSNVRTLLRCQAFRQFDCIYFDLAADGFLYNMVRNIVGTLLEIGRGHWPPERIAAILAAQDRAAAGPKAPAHGLCLQWVQYPAAVMSTESREIADE